MISLHGSDAHALNLPILRTINKKVIIGSDACTANSRATATVAREISGRSDIPVIPMGVNVKLFKPGSSQKNVNDKNGPKILYVGRLIEVKGVRYLIESIPRVLKMHPCAKLTIIGSGPLKSRLLYLSGSLNLKDRVHFIDPVPQEELVKYYQMADAFVLPSVVTQEGEKEGLGLVLLEAMACGVPVIGTRVGGIPDIIRDGQTGLLADQEDSRDLADKIIRVWTDEVLRRKIRTNGLDFVKEEFSWGVVAVKFKKIYEQVIVS